MTRIVFIVLFLCAALTSAQPNDELVVTRRLLKSFKELSKRLFRPCQKRDGTTTIAYNACVDMVAPAADVFGQLMKSGHLTLDNFRSGLPKSGRIESLNDLAATFGHYQQKGIAYERPLLNVTAFNTVIAAARTSSTHEFRLGGNAALMARHLARLGCNMKLGASAGPELVKLIPKGVDLIHDGVKEDDVHLILEFPVGAMDMYAGAGCATQDCGTSVPRDAQLTSPRANRFIVTRHYDTPPMINPPKAFHDLLNAEAAKGTLRSIIVSGFHHLDSVPAVIRDPIITDVAQQLKKLPAATFVHVEVASFGDMEVYAALKNTILPHVNSIGANEQEMASLADYLRTGGVEQGGYPSLPDVGDAFDQLLAVLDMTTLERAHLHSLGFQAICQRESARLPDAAASLVSASVTATTEACAANLEELNPSDITLKFPLNPDLSRFKLQERLDLHNPLITFIATTSFDKYNCGVVPVLVCRQPKGTVGLGDRVSSAGLSVLF